MKKEYLSNHYIGRYFKNFSFFSKFFKKFFQPLVSDRKIPFFHTGYDIFLIINGV